MSTVEKKMHKPYQKFNRQNWQGDIVAAVYIFQSMYVTAKNSKYHIADT